MENWQKEHITKNLADLASKTYFNGDVQADLLSENILERRDVEELVSTKSISALFKLFLRNKK